MNWPMVFPCIPLPLTIEIYLTYTILHTNASTDLYRTCPNHVRQDSTIFSAISKATPLPFSP